MAPAWSITPIRSAPEIGADSPPEPPLIAAAALVFHLLAWLLLGSLAEISRRCLSPRQIRSHGQGDPPRRGGESDGEHEQKPEAPSHPFSSGVPVNPPTLASMKEDSE